MKAGELSLGQSLDLPALDRVDTLAQELALLQDKGKRRIAILGSRHVPVAAIHLVQLVARSLVQEGHSLITSGSQGVKAAVIRGWLAVAACAKRLPLVARVKCCLLYTSPSPRD